MIDIQFLRENPDVVRQNIKNKFQDFKLPLVDEVIELDEKLRKTKVEADELRSKRNKISKEIGTLMAQGKKEEAEQVKASVASLGEQLSKLEPVETELEEKIKKDMMTIPNIIDPSVPIGKDDSENVEIEKFGEPFVPDFEIPYHTDIMEKLKTVNFEMDKLDTLALEEEERELITTMKLRAEADIENEGRHYKDIFVGWFLREIDHMREVIDRKNEMYVVLRRLESELKIIHNIEEIEEMYKEFKLIRRSDYV